MILAATTAAAGSPNGSEFGIRWRVALPHALDPAADISDISVEAGRVTVHTGRKRSTYDVATGAPVAARPAPRTNTVVSSDELARRRIVDGAVAYEITGEGEAADRQRSERSRISVRAVALANAHELWRSDEAIEASYLDFPARHLSVIASDDAYVYVLEVISPNATLVVLDAADGHIVQRVWLGGRPMGDFAKVESGGTRVVMLVESQWLVGLGEVEPAWREITVRGRLRMWQCSGVHPIADATVMLDDDAVNAASTGADGRFRLTTRVDTSLPIPVAYSGGAAASGFPTALVFDPKVPVDMIAAFQYLQMTPAEHRAACGTR